MACPRMGNAMSMGSHFAGITADDSVATRSGPSVRASKAQSKVRGKYKVGVDPTLIPTALVCSTSLRGKVRSQTCGSL